MGYYTGKLIGQFEIQTLLPSTYQQVEYIESTGTQFINTGIVAGVGVRWEIKYAYTSIYALSQNGSSGATNLNYSRFIFASLNNSLYMAIGISFNWSKTLDYNPHIYILDKPNNKTWIDSESKTVLNDFTSSIEALCIFNRNVLNTTDNYKHNGRCYYSKIYDNNVLIQHLIPCYRKSDSRIGLYDIINNIFIINSGTGTFLKGSDI